MTKASDNPFPSILVTEGTEPSPPAAGKQRLYIDSTTHKLKRTDSTGTDVTIEGGDVASDVIWDTKGDLAGGTGTNTAARLAVAANGSFLRAASGQTTGLEWQLNNLAAAVAPTANEDSGDGYSVGSRWINTTTDKEYVCLDASVGAAVWTETTAAGGGGSLTVQEEDASPSDAAVTTIKVPSAYAQAAGTIHIGRPYLEYYSLPLDGTMGDHFDGATLNGRWTRRNIQAGWESYQQAGGSWLRVDIQSATLDQLYTQSMPAGDWDVICSMSYSSNAASMYGLFVLSSTGGGWGPVLYNGERRPLYAVLSAYQYSSNQGYLVNETGAFGKFWVRLSRATNTYSARFSADGYNWSLPVDRTDATTMDRIAVGRVWGGGSTNESLFLDLFDRVS